MNLCRTTCLPVSVLNAATVLLLEYKSQKLIILTFIFTFLFLVLRSIALSQQTYRPVLLLVGIKPSHIHIYPALCTKLFKSYQIQVEPITDPH